VKKTLRSIPEDASVCAQNTLVPHLAFRDTIHVFHLKWKTTDYIVLADQRISVFPSSDKDYFDKINYIMNSGRYEVTREENGITIFKKIKDSPGVKRSYMDTVSLKSWPSARLARDEFIGFGKYPFKRGDFFRAEIFLNEPSDKLILIAKSIHNKSVEFDTRSIIEEKNKFKMIVEGGPAFNKQSDTINFFIWNKDEKLVSISKFTLLERNYK
jgi:hypothetical protein